MGVGNKCFTYSFGNGESNFKRFLIEAWEGGGGNLVSALLWVVGGLED